MDWWPRSSATLRSDAPRITSHDAKVLTKVVPGEVLDAGNLAGGVEDVLDVLDRLTGVRAGLVREDVLRLRLARLEQFLERGLRRDVERQGERPAALGARNPHHGIGEVDLIPAQVEQAAASQAGVGGQNDLLFEVWGGRADAGTGAQGAGRGDQPVVLLARQVAQPRVVLVEQLHSPDGTHQKRGVSRSSPRRTAAMVSWAWASHVCSSRSSTLSS